MNITLKGLSCGAVHKVKRSHSTGEHEVGLWIEHGAYMLRHTVRVNNALVYNQIYSERVRSTTIKQMNNLFKLSVAWIGQSFLYVFVKTGNSPKTYYTFASSQEVALYTVCMNENLPRTSLHCVCDVTKNVLHKVKVGA